MHKKVMIAVDESVHSKNAIRYASNISATIQNANFTLFYVQPMISHYLLDEAEKDPASEAELKRIIDKNTLAGIGLLEKYKEQMIMMGVSEQYIEVVTQPRMLGLAKDIIQYSHSKSYDSIIVGRRGLSGLQEVIIGSVSANVLEHSKAIPVWLIGGKVDSSKVMIAVDGSENSLKAVDHFALMVSNNPDIRISFFHAQPKFRDFCPIDTELADNDRFEDIFLRGNKRCINQFYTHALSILEDSGFKKNQIELKIADSFFNPGKAIVDEAKQGGYDTIIIGRRGINRAFFTGSVSRYVINQISDTALWVVP